jgi:hypothetical protein
MDSDFEVKYDAKYQQIKKVEKPPPLPPRQVYRCENGDIK